MNATARQLTLTWVVGSVTMGTVSAIFLSAPVPNPYQGSLLPLLPDTSLIKPLAALPLAARVAVLALGVTLLAGLAGVAWFTRWESLLPDNARGRGWWVVLTGGLGLAAWFFAATVTFGAQFPADLQLVLGYAGGGLPFALVAAMLQRSWRVCLVAAVVSALLIVAGFLTVSAGDPQAPNAFTVYFRYLSYLLNSPPAACAPCAHGWSGPAAPRADGRVPWGSGKLGG